MVIVMAALQRSSALLAAHTPLNCIQYKPRAHRRAQLALCGERQRVSSPRTRKPPAKRCRIEVACSNTVVSSTGWAEFAAAVSGEWSGLTVTFDSGGAAQDIPYQYVPDAFREWEMVPKDWHTQTSSLASDEGLLTKLKRLMPIVGCEADAVAFTEDRRAALQPEQGAQTMLPDGSYSTGPVALGDDLAARVEHCLVQEEGERLRGVFHLRRRGDGDEAWGLGELELHLEHRTGDYDGGTSLEACGYNMSELSAKAAPEASQLEGPWHLVSCTDFQLSESDVCTAAPHSDQAEGFKIEVEGRLLLPGGAWASVATGASGELTAQLGWLGPSGTLRAATRSFQGGRLCSSSFVTANKS